MNQDLAMWAQADQVSDVGLCVYAIYRDDALYYIGQTRRFKQRMYVHKATNPQGFPLEGITIRYLVTDDATTLEPTLIQQYKPIGNRLDTGNICECRCGNVWISRVPSPKACPRCKTRLDAPVTNGYR